MKMAGITSYTLFSMLLLSPLNGQAQEAAVSKLLVEGALKGIGGWAAGKAMNSIFPPHDNPPSRAQLSDSISQSEAHIIASIKDLKKTVVDEGQKNALDNHLDRMNDLGAIPVVSAIRDYNPLLMNPVTAQSIQDKDAAILLVISNTGKYADQLSKDINIGTRSSGYNGFWRSFGPYVSNQATNLTFRIEQWQAKQVQDGYKVNGHMPSNITSDNLRNLQKLYNHLEKNVPTIPISDGSHVQNGKPALQHLNCVSRTDPDTQLFTSKGRFISRYMGVHDVADRLPDPTRYWMMYAHCRSNKFSTPDVYYGWKNVNHKANGTRVGPLATAAGCQQVVTFGRCQSSGSAYGCTQDPYRSKHSSPSNEIGNHHGRTLYTKYLWTNGPHAISGVSAGAPRAAYDRNAKYRNAAGDTTFEKAPQDKDKYITGPSARKFNEYLKTFENTVCANDPSGNNIAAQIPSAPALPHLRHELFDSLTPVDMNHAPEEYKKGLPLTVIKIKALVARKASGHSTSTGTVLQYVNAYYFIKRNPTRKTPELSKPYQSAMSAAHHRSLHYFTEFTDPLYGLPAAYCSIASMVGIGNHISNTLKVRALIDYKEHKQLAAAYRLVSYKLGITKEPVQARCGPEIGKYIEATLHDEFTINLDRKDHQMRNCMKVAAIQVYNSDGRGSFNTDTYRASRAACFTN